MKKIAFSKTNRLSQLHDELIAAVPSVAPQNGRAVMTVEGLGDDIRLTVPDNADVAAIGAVVSAHVPSADPYYGETADTKLIRLILTDPDATAYLTGTPTVAQTVMVVRKIILAIRAFARRQ